MINIKSYAVKTVLSLLLLISSPILCCTSMIYDFNNVPAVWLGSILSFVFGGGLTIWFVLQKRKYTKEIAIHAQDGRKQKDADIEELLYSLYKPIDDEKMDGRTKEFAEKIRSYYYIENTEAIERIIEISQNYYLAKFHFTEAAWHEVNNKDWKRAKHQASVWATTKGQRIGLFFISLPLLAVWAIPDLDSSALIFINIPITVFFLWIQYKNFGFPPISAWMNFISRKKDTGGEFILGTQGVLENQERYSSFSGFNSFKFENYNFEGLDYISIELSNIPNNHQARGSIQHKRVLIPIPREQLELANFIIKHSKILFHFEEIKKKLLKPERDQPSPY